MTDILIADDHEVVRSGLRAILEITRKLDVHSSTALVHDPIRNRLIEA